MVPTEPAPARFGTTTDLTGRPRRQRSVVGAGIVLLLAVSVGGMVYTLRVRREMERAGAIAAAAAQAAAAHAVTAQAPPGPSKQIAPPPGARPGPSATASALESIPAIPATAIPATGELGTRDAARRRHGASGVPPRALAGAPAVGSSSAATAGPSAAGPSGAMAAPVTAPEPPPRGAPEVLAEADRLLGQGEVADACAHGEEAKRMSPRLPAVYKLLGKCYMRAGRAREANDNYKQYLELAPSAPDAPFVKSMIK